MSVYRIFGFEEVVWFKELAHPAREKRLSAPDCHWVICRRIFLRKVSRLRLAVSNRRAHSKTGINEGEGTFYGTKFEIFTLRLLRFGPRVGICGTTRVDFQPA